MGKESAFSAGDQGLILGSGRSSGEGNGNTLQYSCLKNPMDKGAWWAAVHGVAKSRTSVCGTELGLELRTQLKRDQIYFHRPLKVTKVLTVLKGCNRLGERCGKGQWN